ncbi:hypothetical protein GCM10027610_100860 [Dactylosporangium cerinum]
MMTALTTFFVSTTTTLNTQRGLQTAVRLAHDGVDLVKSLPGAKIVAGRGELDATQQLDELKDGKIPGLKLPGLANLLATMTPAFDADLGSLAAGVAPALPIVPELVTVNNAGFKRYWFVGSCNMPLGNDLTLLSADKLGVCSLLSLPGILVPFYRVIVAVTWDNDRGCASTGGVCSFVTQTMVSAATADPVFNPSITVTPPLPDNPGNQTDEVTVPMVKPLTLAATTAYPPLAWTVEGLPPGLSYTTAGVITGTPTTAGSYIVRIIATDAMSTNDASFTWTVAALPALAPTTQTWDPNTAVAYQVPMTGGVGPNTWTATSLPAGLVIDPATGVISSTKTPMAAAANSSVKVTVVDANKKTTAATFQWNWKVAVQYPNASTPIVLAKDSSYPGQVLGFGGTPPYTWSADIMPPGLTLNATTGAVSGKVTGTTRYLVTLKVTDSKGVTNSTLVPVTITDSGLRVTSPPFNSKPDLSSAKGKTFSLPALGAAGGTAPYKWTATGMPTGVTFNTTTYQFEGSPTTVGSSTVTLTVTDKVGATSVYMFVWTVTA